MTHHHSSNKRTEQPPTLSTRVLAEIEREQVVPRPRWTYVAANRALWVTAVLAIAVAALAAAATIFILANAGWQYASATHGTVFALLLAVLPSVWLVALIVFALVGYWNIRHTTHGYRYPLPLVVAGVVLLALLSGAALFAAGLGQGVEEGLGRHLPFYRPFLDQERSWWLDTSQGLLVGNIISLAPDLSSFTLRTSSGKVWRIDASDLRIADFSVLARGGLVRVVGVPRSATSTVPFHACFVFPWQIYGAFPVPIPPIAAFTASTSEIISRGARSELCRGVRPYQSLRALEPNE
ncbi:MAG: hypothetical protein B7X04_01280 [Parcubacteria group bacterium 21-54-25]|nr:MAG: hypothetical protein B7X04_01280 [Parcubacteria group bacterium 21-54-25]HQU07563.1 hypothetical protein [Candidatus Paceibacterota bacterium]